MKRVNKKNLNTVEYWDEHIAEPDFGLRQQKYLDLAGKGNKIAELGCGLSPFLDKARVNFKECYGIDFSAKTIQTARSKYPNITYTVSDVIETPYPEKYFDVTVAGEVIEHLKHPNKLIAEMMRITKRRIIISTAKMEYPEPEHLWEFSKEDFPMGACQEIKSERYPGRSYLFITIDL